MAGESSPVQTGTDYARISGLFNTSRSTAEVILMAKGKYEQWLTEDGLIRVQGWARDGLTDEQIAHNMGIRASTFYEWKKKFPEFSEALKENKEIADRNVENALYKAALEGNTTAIIFWLKNRKAKDWRDKPKEVQEQEDSKLIDLIRAIKEV